MDGGLTQLQGIHLAQAFEALHHGRTLAALGHEAVENTLFLGLVQSIEHILAQVDTIQRRHSDIDVTSGNQRPKVAQEQGTEKRRDVRAIGISVSEDANLAIAQTTEVCRAWLDTNSEGDVVHLL